MNRITSDWLTNRQTQRAMSLLTGAGFDTYAVGGCVRNDLLDVPVADIDISTNAHPDKVIALAEEAGLKSIPTGIEHGTITVVIEGEPFEITTFRADVETDGRRAVVRFADSLFDDAIRRDFTMNALYVDQEGVVTDPVGGLAHLAERRFVFIDDAQRRIREDYLRILRYFRFMAWYGDPENGFEAETLAAIAANLDGLDQLSRERVGAEIIKLLSAENAAPAVAVMGQTRVLAHVLPGCDANPLGIFDHHCAELGLACDPIARLAAIGLQDGKALRLSKLDQKKLALFHSLIADMIPVAEIAYDHGAETAKQVLALRAALFQQAPDRAEIARVDEATHATFPLSPKDLMPDWQGVALGDALRTAKHMWIASDFKLRKSQILAELKKLKSEG